MAQIALDLSPQQWRNYRPSQRLKASDAEVEGLRPATISEDTLQRLTDYLDFRHIMRNVYTHNFEADGPQKLVTGLPDVLVQVSAELRAFADFLEQQNL